MTTSFAVPIRGGGNLRVSEPRPEITEAEARILEDLAEMRESHPEGYEALIGDLGTDGPEGEQ